jgi:uncharacterized protein (TIGR02646 family)
MHWVDRGPEPVGLAVVRSRYTPGWVERYRNGIGPKPSDTHWRDFHGDLSKVFFSLCAYCEELCRGVVDHFRPTSKFPELVYRWSNWVFACQDGCNLLKSDKWPRGGYIDPCTRSRQGRPENFFGFDTLTGEIIPKAGLSPARRKKAIQMTDDLGLNEFHHLTKRREWLWLVSETLNNHSDEQNADLRNVLSRLVARSTQLSSITRAWLVEQGYPEDF